MTILDIARACSFPVDWSGGGVSAGQPGNCRVSVWVLQRIVSLALMGGHPSSKFAHAQTLEGSRTFPGKFWNLPFMFPCEQTPH